MSPSSLCSQTCRNTLGSYECSCLDGYRQDPLNPNSCRVGRGKVGILYTGQASINLLDVLARQSTVLVSAEADSVDYHSSLGRIFWLSTKSSQLFSADLNTPHSHKLLLDDVSGAEDLTVDWTHDLIIWTDSILKCISLSSLGRQELLVKQILRSFLQTEAAGWWTW